MISLKLVNFKVSTAEKKIIKGINLTINPGEIHVVMGPNGSGKSTLALSICGHSSYKISKQAKILLGSQNISSYKPEERSRAGIFLAFQQPIAVPGVNFFNLLRLASRNLDSEKKEFSLKSFHEMLKRQMRILNIPDSMLQRYVNDNLSGGEKKKMECLQALVLKPKFAIFDEIDTGLDVDALKTAAHTIQTLAKNHTGILLITHYQRILKYLQPHHVHIMTDGKIVQSGDIKLAEKIEKQGYSQFK